MAERDRDGSVVGSGAGNNGAFASDRFDDWAKHTDRLVMSKSGRLARGAADHQSIAPGIQQHAGQVPGGRVGDSAGLGEGGNHGGEHCTKRWRRHDGYGSSRGSQEEYGNISSLNMIDICLR